MLFRVLGPLEVRAGDRWAGIGAPKWRALLAALLLAEPGHVLSAERLAGELWGENLPSGARKLVSGYVVRLRQLIGDPGGQVIVTRSPGYQVRVGPADVDASAFEDLLIAGRAALGAQNAMHAAKVLGEALTLWRGPALADVPPGPLTGLAAERLEELRLTALELRAEADLSCGRAGETIPGLRSLAAAHPLRERLWLLLMRALQAGGRSAEALGAYAQAREVIAAELGADPGPELQRLHQHLLGAALLSAAQPPAVTVPAAGPAAPVVPRQLPAPPAYFTGRSEELAELAKLASQVPDSGGTVLISAISGMTGVGKTALALHWAHQVAAEFPDGQLYVNLRGFGPSGPPVPPDEAIRGFLHALGTSPESIPGDPQAQTGLLRSLLAGKRMLLVLDNARDTAQVRPLLPGSPGCLVVVTSRSQLTGLVAAEGAASVVLAPFTQAEALELLSRRLGAQRVAEEPAAVAELIRLCAHLALALAIVAARAQLAPGVPLRSLAAELDDATTRLDALSAEDAGGSVRALFAWSYQNLGVAAARMFRLLALHPGPDISVVAAASLAGLPLHLARRALGELAGANLVIEHAPGRFVLHDLLRAYAGEQAADSDTGAELNAARRRILDHYLYTAHAAVKALYPAADDPLRDPLEPGTLPECPASRDAARGWLAAEHQVLLAVSRLAAQAGLDVHAARLPMALATYLDRSGHWQDGAATQRTALAALQRTGDRTGQARAHRFLGRALIRLGSYDAGEEHLARAMDLFRELDDPLGQARCHLAITLLRLQQARHRDALAHAEHALPLYAAAGHRIGQAAALNHIAASCLHVGDHARALTCARQALVLHRELGNVEGEAEALDTIGWASQRLGGRAEAIVCWQRVVGLYGETGNRYNQAEVLARLADAHQEAGDIPQARGAWLRALAILDSLHHPDAGHIRAKLDGSAGSDDLPGGSGLRSAEGQGGPALR